MSTKTIAERGTADAIASVVMDKLSGGRGIVREGDIVTPKPTVKDEDPERYAGFQGWHEFDVREVRKVAVVLKAPNGKEIGAHRIDDLLLTSRSELQAQAQLESIREMVAALKSADSESDETREDSSLDKSEAARETILQDALSVEVRSGWLTMDIWANKGSGKDDFFTTPAEFKILLCTGGPAVQIIGELDEHGEPEKARLQHQDWGTPWTDFRISGEDADVLLAYARCFYFGE